MPTVAFVSVSSSISSSFTTSRNALAIVTSTSPNRSLKYPSASFQTSRCRLAKPSIVAHLESEGDATGLMQALEVFEKPVPLPEGFAGVMQQFSLALLGVYAAMNGVSPAAAIPEALVEAFKSKPASLVHPAVMWTLLATCLYTFYLGYQSSLVRKSEPEKRKALIKGKFADRHFKTSSSLFAVMTIATFSGMANTFARTGKLFPGPHLYAGLGLVATMSVMTSFVPYMQKGKDWARNAHFTVAFLAVGLFGWQAKSGMVIVGKLLGWS